MYLWEGITEFVAVAESTSFTLAAKALGISVAQVSRQINTLETRLATKLLYRTTRKVSLTEEGHIYYQHCRQLLDGLEAAERTMSNLKATPRGKLKITTATTYGENVIVPLINNFVKQYPELEVEYLLTNQKVDLTETGFDLAIRLGKLDDSSMIAKRLTLRKLYMCASKEYLSIHGEPHLISELEHHNCLQGTLGYWRFQENGKDRTIKVRGNLTCNSGLALVDAALKGMGIVQLPDYYVDEHIQAGRLTAILENHQPSDEGIWALYPHNRHLSPKVRMLVDYLSGQLDSERSISDR